MWLVMMCILCGFSEIIQSQSDCPNALEDQTVYIEHINRCRVVATCITGCPVSHFKMHTNKAVPTVIAASQTGGNRRDCFYKCFDTAGCYTISWDETTNTCNIYTSCGTGCSMTASSSTTTFVRECYDSIPAPTCPTLTDTATLYVTTTDTTLCSEATYTCATGYELPSRVSNRMCLPDSTWSGNEPVCTIIACDAPVNPSNGDVRLLGQDTSFQQQIEYHCNTGYIMSGTAIQECLATKTWSDNPPVCNIVDCGPLDAPGNGTVNFPGGTVVNQVALFNCNPGFKLSDSSSVTCSATALWNKDPPTCVYNECPEIDNTSSRLVQSPKVRIPGSTAIYTCITGYELSEGMNQQTCQTDLVWSGIAPTCSKVNCSSPDTPQNGSIALLNGTTAYEDLVQYSCNVGFNLSGADIRECFADGIWSGLVPVCNIVYCNAPIEPQNGSVSTPGGTAFQQQALYDCDEGYVLNGSSFSTCNSSALWDATSPSCDLIVDCGQLDPPGNGTVIFPGGTTVNEEANFICDPGFKLSETSFLICTESGAWNKDPPTCLYNECPELDDTSTRIVQNPAVRIPGSAAIYTCVTGYELSTGMNQQTCQESLAWDGDAPTCRKINCSSPETPQNGSLFLLNGTITYNDHVQYKCDDGFNLSGAEIRECLVDGNWSGVMPVCNIVYCNAPIGPQNGSVSTRGGSVFQQKALYECDEGFLLNGSSFSTCNASALWDTASPYCDVIDCGPIIAPSQGHVILSNGIGGNTTFRANATFLCNAGYQLTHYQQRTCSNTSEWSNFSPACIPKAMTTPSTARLYIMPCICNTNRTFVNMTQDEIIAYLVRETAIQENATSLSRYKRLCRSDPRASSAIIGVVGSIVIGTIFGLIFLLDIPTLFMHFKNALARQSI